MSLALAAGDGVACPTVKLSGKSKSLQQFEDAQT